MSIITKARGLTKNGIVAIIGAFLSVIITEACITYVGKTLDIVEKLLLTFISLFVAVILITFAFGGKRE